MSLCPTCKHGRLCATWGEWKCVNLKQRRKSAVSCSEYKKLDKNEKQPDCRCEDCLRKAGEEE